MLKERDGQVLNLYTDKNGVFICENDIILFDNGHYYQCIVFEHRYCLKCLSVDLPLILLNKICIWEGLSSGGIIKNFKM